MSHESLSINDIAENGIIKQVNSLKSILNEYDIINFAHYTVITIKTGNRCTSGICKSIGILLELNSQLYHDNDLMVISETNINVIRGQGISSDTRFIFFQDQKYSHPVYTWSLGASAIGTVLVASCQH